MQQHQRLVNIVEVNLGFSRCIRDCRGESWIVEVYQGLLRCIRDC